MRNRLAPPVTELYRHVAHETTTAGSVGGGLARPMVANEPDNGDDDTWRQQNPQSVAGNPLAPTNGGPDANHADEFYARYGAHRSSPAALYTALAHFTRARGLTGDQTRDLQATLDRQYNIRSFGIIPNPMSTDSNDPDPMIDNDIQKRR